MNLPLHSGQSLPLHTILTYDFPQFEGFFRNYDVLHIDSLPLALRAFDSALITSLLIHKLRRRLFPIISL